MILLLDNYDSFTWNLFHYVEQLCDDVVEIRRNDEISIEEVKKYDSIILSPGPGLPADAGIMPGLIKAYADKIPILGICLGHQAIAESFGATLVNLDEVWHGIQRELQITDSSDRLFKNIRSPFYSGHYHSWVVDKSSLPGDFTITATDQFDTIMAISHKKFPLSGVQFHPESIMTDQGMEIIRNWLIYCGHIKEDKVI